MNTDNGALEFDAYFNNEKLKSSAKEAEKIVKGFTETAVGSGEKIDDAFKITAENIKIQKDVIANIEKQLNNLNIEISKLKPGTAQDQLKQQAQQLTAELKAEKDALKFLETQTEKTDVAHKSLRGQLRAMREELVMMERAGKRGSVEYQNLQKKAGELADAMGDAQNQIKAMADDEGMFRGIVSAVSGVTGGFSAAQGAIGLFAGENENLNKIMLKVQSLMAITIGLQQVAETLNKDSYFNVVILTKAKEMFAVAELKVATALGVSTVAARVLMATLTLGLSIAITAIVVLISKMSSKAAEARKEQDAFNKAAAEAAFKPVAAINQLSAEWTALGDNIKAKQKFIEDHVKDFDDLGVSVNNVADAEKLLVDNKGAFIESLMMKAKAMAASEMAAEKYKLALEKQMELESTPKTVTMREAPLPGSTGSSFEVKNSKYVKLDAGRQKLEDEGNALFKKATEFTAKEKEILKGIGVSSDNIVKGSITAIETSISKLQEQYKKAANDKDRKALLDKITDEQKKLNTMDQSGSTSKAASADPFKDSLEKKKALYQQYYKWVNSNDTVLQKAAKTEFAGLLQQGNSYIEYLKAQRDQLMESGTSASKAKLKTVNNMIADETKKTIIADFQDALQTQMNGATSLMQMLEMIQKKRKELSGDGSELDNGKKELLDRAEADVQQQAKEQTDKLLEDYASYLVKKRKLQEDYNNDMILLQKRFEKATDPEEKSSISSAMTGRTNKFVKDSKSSGDSEYDDLLAQYRTFEQKKQAIIDQFDEKRRKAQQQGNSELIKMLNEAQSDALSGLSLEELQNSDLFKELFGNLDQMAVSKMIELRDRLEKEWSKLDLDPEQLKAIRDQLDQVTEKIQQKNPFAALADAISKLKQDNEALDINKWMANPDNAGKGVDDYAKAYKAAMQNMGRDTKNLFKATGAALNAIKQIFDQVVASLDKLGIKTDDQTKKVLSDISGMVGGAANLAMGIATGNPMQIIQGSIDLLANGYDLIAGAKSRKLDRAIAEHDNRIKQLSMDYKLLGIAVDNALGTDVYDRQKEEIDNLVKQNQEYFANLQAEMSKSEKDIDQGKIDEYNAGLIDTAQQIADIKKSIAEDLMQTTIKDLANNLTDSLVEAFMNGEDAAVAFDKTVNDVMTNIVKNAFKKNVLEKALKPLTDSMTTALADYNITDEEMAAILAVGATVKTDVLTGMSQYEEMLSKLGLEAADSASSSLTGAVKGVSEETASIVSGQLNAMRINQIESIVIIRAQLMALNQIVTNTAYNINLVEILNVLRTISAGNSLRSQGL